MRNCLQYTNTVCHTNIIAFMLSLIIKTLSVTAAVFATLHDCVCRFIMQYLSRHIIKFVIIMYVIKRSVIVVIS